MTCTLLALLTVALGDVPENPVLVELTQRGVCIAGEAFVKLKAPSMPDGLDAAAQGKVLAEVAGPRRRVSVLLRNSVVAPFVLKIAQVPMGEGEPPMRSVDLWFVAYGPLDRFTSEESLDELAESAASSGKSRLPSTEKVLKEEQLKARGLCAEESENRSEHFFYSSFPLFDRVQISATRRAVLTSGPESVLLAAMIDPRFTADAEYPNQWQPVKRDRQGRFELGPPVRYESAGLYTKVTRLVEPRGALFIEYHQLFHEPVGWFDGANLLRSKLPLMAQDAVRKLRRKLREPIRSQAK